MRSGRWGLACRVFKVFEDVVAAPNETASCWKSSGQGQAISNLVFLNRTTMWLLWGEFFNKELTIWVKSVPVLFLLTVFSIFGCKEYNKSDISIDHLVMSMCRVVSCIVERGCLLWPVCSLGRTLLAFTLLPFVLQGQTWLLLQVSLDFLFLHSSPLWWKEHLLWCLS